MALTAVAIALIACGVALGAQGGTPKVIRAGDSHVRSRVAPIRATHDTPAAKTVAAATATNRAFVYSPGNTKHEEESAAAKKHEEEAAATAAKKHQEEEATQIATLLRRELTPSGKAAKIAALLKSGVFSISFRALEAGTAVIGW
ncbi:MAG TPA: hypothetical protein VII01_00945, partial [Solirubrobacteraceae bacterium]